MKIALVWNAAPQLRDISFRFEHYVGGFESLGHESVVVCRRNSAEGAEVPVAFAQDDAELAGVGFWRRLAADVAIVITWHRMSGMLAAIRAAETRVIAISDSDGLVGLRAHPRMTLERMILYRRGLRGKLGCLKYWLGRYLTDGLTGGSEDREFLASTRSSDVVIFGSEPATAAFRRFLRRGGEPELGRRLRVVPYAVPGFFCELPLPAVKDDRILAVGRWSDPQKDAGLLRRALKLFLGRGRPTRVAIFGRDGERQFGELARSRPALELRGPQPPDAVLQELRSSRAIVFSSRWESGPHAATEALALGSTLVGAPIPNLVGLADGGRFGAIAASRRPRALAAAIGREMSAWDRGGRDHRAIASHWRQRLRPASVCRQLLEALDSVE